MNDAPSDRTVPPPRAPERRLGIVIGVGYVLLGHGLAIGVAALMGGYTILYPMIFAGATQLVYVIPGIVWAHVTGRRQIRLGIVLAAAVTMLVNGGCWGVAAIEGSF